MIARRGGEFLGTCVRGVFFFLESAFVTRRHVCNYKDACGSLGSPIGGENGEVCYMCCGMAWLLVEFVWALGPLKLSMIGGASCLRGLMHACDADKKPLGPRRLPSCRKWLRLRVCSRCASAWSGHAAMTCEQFAGVLRTDNGVGQMN
jgi:hypothetical protein